MPRQTEIVKKQLCEVFAENSLNITVEANYKATNFIDITIDLQRGEYKAHMKPNNIPVYIHKESKHPPNIIENIPKRIKKRLSNIFFPTNQPLAK